MSGSGAYGKVGPAPSPSSSNLSPSAPPFTIGRHPVVDPFVGLTSDPYHSAAQYFASDPPSSFTYEPHIASTQYSVADTSSGLIGPDQGYTYPVNSSGHNGFSLYSDPNSEFNSMPLSLPAVEYSFWNPLGTSFNAYMYGGQFSDGASSIPVEAGTYYPSYVPPSTTDVVPSSGLLATFHIPPPNGPFLGEYDTNLTSLGDKDNGGSSLWKMSDSKGSALQEFPYPFYSLGGSISGSSTSQGYVNQGPYASDVLKTCNETGPEIRIQDDSKPFTNASTEQSDGADFLGNNLTYMLPNHSRKEIVCSIPMDIEPIWQSQYLKPQTNHWDVQVGQSTSYRKWTAQPDSSLASNEPSLDLIMELPSDCNDIPHMNTVHRNAANGTSDINSSGQLLSSGATVQFEAPLQDRQLGRNGHRYAALSPTCNSELTSCKGLSNPINNEMLGCQDSFNDRDSFKAAFNFDRTVQPVHYFSENSDQLNPAIDSPCWKGISFHNVSPFGHSEVVSTQLVKETETCSNLKFQASVVSNLNSESAIGGSSQTSNRITETLENEHVDNIMESVPRGNSITESLSGKHQSNDEEKANSYPLRKRNSCFAFSPDNLKYGNGDCIAGESSCSGFESSKLQQCLGKGVSIAEKAKKTINAPIFSPPFQVSNISSMHCTLDFKDLSRDVSQDIYVQGLIKEMHNLSELLLVQCSSSTCGIKEEDNSTLKQVIANLITCTQQESSKEQATFHHDQELREVDRSQNGKLQQLNKVSITDDEDQLNNHHPKNNKKNNGDVGLKNPKLDSVPEMCNNVDMVNVDKMSQAIKKVLIENFDKEETHAQSLMYKNLWLDAEAALSSSNLRARYNRIKIEMEKCQSIDKSKDVSYFEKLQRSADSPKSMAEKFVSENARNSSEHISVLMSNRENDKAQETTGPQSCDTVMTASHISKCCGRSSVPGVDLSGVKLSSQMETENQMALNVIGHTLFHMSHCDSSLLNTSCHADDVLARLHILKCRGESTVGEDTSVLNLTSPNANQMSCAIESLPTSDLTHNSASIRSNSCLDDDMPRCLPQADLSVSGYTPDSMLSSKISSDDSPISDVNHNSFPVKGPNSLPDDVMARINILASRGDGSISEDTLKQLAPGTEGASHSDVSHSLLAKDASSPGNDVMARLKILTSRSGRPDAGNTADEEEMSSPELIKGDGLEKNWELVTCLKGISQYRTDTGPSSAEIKRALEAQQDSIQDYSLIQSDIISRRLKQNYFSGNGDCLSDWEDLGKEELPCQMTGISSQ